MPALEGQGKSLLRLLVRNMGTLAQRFTARMGETKKSGACAECSDRRSKGGLFGAVNMGAVAATVITSLTASALVYKYLRIAEEIKKYTASTDKVEIPELAKIMIFAL